MQNQGLIPWQKTRTQMPKLKIPHATTKTLHSQINILKHKQKKQQQQKKPFSLKCPHGFK